MAVVPLAFSLVKGCPRFHLFYLPHLVVGPSSSALHPPSGGQRALCARALRALLSVARSNFPLAPPNGVVGGASVTPPPLRCSLPACPSSATLLSPWCLRHLNIVSKPLSYSLTERLRFCHCYFIPTSSCLFFPPFFVRCFPHPGSAHGVALVPFPAFPLFFFAGLFLLGFPSPCSVM